VSSIPEDQLLRGDRTAELAEPTSEIHENGMTKSQALNLYTSHCLSTWNIRTYVGSLKQLLLVSALGRCVKSFLNRNSPL